MRMMGYCILGGAVVPAIVVPMVGADQRQDMVQKSHKLQQDLSTQVRILSGITDAKSAQAALKPLTASMQTLKKMKAGTKDAELWLYLDNTPGVKFPIIVVLENLMVQLQRLEKADFFGNSQLRNMLSPLCGKRPTR